MIEKINNILLNKWLLLFLEFNLFINFITKNLWGTISNIYCILMILLIKYDRK